MAMESHHNRLKEINAQIKLKLAEGDLKGAERLSAKLVETAEGIEAASEQGNPFDALSMVSKLMTSVTAHFPSVAATTVATSEQLELARRDAIDNEHLRLLTVFHYVNAGLLLMISSVFLLYALMALFMILASFSAPGSQGPPLIVGTMMMIITLIPVAFTWSLAAANVWAGRQITNRQNHLRCLIVSAVNCMNIPFGTILGVCSILVLARDSVKSKYPQISS